MMPKSKISSEFYSLCFIIIAVKFQIQDKMSQEASVNSLPVNAPASTTSSNNNNANTNSNLTSNAIPEKLSAHQIEQQREVC